MKCPICNKELEIRNKKVGETADGEAIYNAFAICHDCKKQWNLDKQRAKKEVDTKTPKPKRKKRPVNPNPVPGNENPVRKAPVSESSAKPAAPARKKKPVPSGSEANTQELPQAKAAATEKKAAPKKRPVSPEAKEAAPRKKPAAPVKEKTMPEKKTVPAKKKKAALDETVAIERPGFDEEAPRPKKKPRPVKPAPRAMEDPIEEFSDALDSAFEDQPKPVRRKQIDNRKSEQTYSNIPPKHVRESREKEMRENYQNMLDEDDEDEGGRFPVVLVVILVILILAAAAFAGYWFFLR